LFGNLNGSEYSSEDGKKFAFAYFREDLKDIYAQQKENKDNPHKTKHVDECSKALGHSQSHSYSNGDHNGMTKTFDDQYYLDVIGTSYCRSRAIACTKDEYTMFEQWRVAKANLVSKHQTELGIQVDEAELIRTNSTGLTIYNPSNLASMIKGMKNKQSANTREAKILARKQYEESLN
jgi:hypothetical protein